MTHSKKFKADQLVQENRFEEAKALYLEICRTDESDVEAWINLSVTNRRLNHFQEAEECGRQAVRLQPELALSHYTLATVAQPIYQHAKYRWNRYAKEFNSVMPILRPCIEYFGYAE